MQFFLFDYLLFVKFISGDMLLWKNSVVMQSFSIRVVIWFDYYCLSNCTKVFLFVVLQSVCWPLILFLVVAFHAFILSVAVFMCFACKLCINVHICKFIFWRWSIKFLQMFFRLLKSTCSWHWQRWYCFVTKT